MSFDTNEFYLKSSEEMAESFSDMPEALASTLEIAERCDTTIALKQQLIPRFDCPDGRAEEEYLRALVDEGLRKRYGDPIPAAGPRARRHGARRHRQHGLQRLLPDRLGLRRLREGQRHRGRPRPWLGRRLASSPTACEITDVDPLRYDLLFERFLNAERVSMPDIDIDFSVRGRERVIRYVTEKYGADRVAQIITFGRMFPRAATRDAARVLGHDYGVGDRLAKLIPDPIRAARRASRTACSRAPSSPPRSPGTRPPSRSSTSRKGLEGIVRNALDPRRRRRRSPTAR